MAMRCLCVGLLLVVVVAHVSYAFEIDGLSSGISKDKAQLILERSAYTNIQSKDNGIVASGAHRFILLNFCKDELVLVQKHLEPAFENFIRLIDEKRKELGKPFDAWTEPADQAIPVERNAVSFLWRDGVTSVKVTFTSFASNNQLDILFEIRNKCRQVLP